MAFVAEMQIAEGFSPEVPASEAAWRLAL